MYPKPIGPKRPVGNPAFRLVQSKPTVKVDPLHRIFTQDAEKQAKFGRVTLTPSAEIAEQLNLPLRKVAKAQAQWAQKHGMDRFSGRPVNTAVGQYTTTYQLPTGIGWDWKKRDAIIEKMKKANGL